MTGIIIGAILIVAGGLLAFIVSPRIKNKNTEIQFMKTTPIAEIKETLKANEAEGLSGYREYVELKGAAASDKPIKTPYSENEVAYYEAEIYQVFEEIENYTDQNGQRQQRINRTENRMSDQKSPGPIVLKDEASGEKAYIELAGRMQLDTLKTLDKFEPMNMMNQYSFFSSFRYNPAGTKTLGFRMIERTIPLDHPLYVLGDAYLANAKLMIEKPSDKKKPFIVSVKSENDLIRGNKAGATAALIGGIVVAVLGIVAIFLL